ncbi:unnamed protein product [Euphydryas editha]|uniref:Integrase catalytic domain-containing protein n=1 Tax=Euphydryas editha TaxID=104508 RepID=A0AAU9UNC6_EUPED|nr:unnamed protein product [Euphydryas editha]
MAIRAIHLEAVSDLTSQGFIPAFKRFVARRGHCAHIWSDNRTNFKRTSRELWQLFQTEKLNISSDIADWLVSKLCILPVTD